MTADEKLAAKKAAKRAKRKDRRVTVRFTYRENQRLLWLAKEYAQGDVAKWMRFAALEAPRKYLK